MRYRLEGHNTNYVNSLNNFILRECQNGGELFSSVTYAHMQRGTVGKNFAIAVHN